MKQPRLVISGRIELLRNIHRFCQQVYLRTFGPEEGPRRFAKLTILDALALWHAGFPASSTLP